MSFRYPKGGFISAFYDPLNVPNAPTIGTATVGNEQASVTFTAPLNVGGSAITSYTVVATDSSSGATFTGTGSSSPVVVTGLTNGNTYTAKVFATNTYGPGPLSAATGSFSPYLPKLYSTGSQTYGVLGTNNGISTSSPTQVSSSSAWVSVTAQAYSAAGITSLGTMYGWGKNDTGQIGVGDRVNKSSPTQIGALTTWASVWSGADYMVAIKTDGTLWGWGENASGGIGNNSVIYRSSPVQVGALTTWSKISAYRATAAIKTDGTLWMWGYQPDGQLGIGDRVDRSSPVQVGALTDWAYVSCSECIGAIKTNGTLWMWGKNDYGRLGVDDKVNRSSPVQVGALTNWAYISAGGSGAAVLAVKTDGTLWAWGSNSGGKLGISAAALAGARSSPVQVGSLTDWSYVLTSASSYAVKTDGTLWVWGYNSNGELGLDDLSARSSPVQLGSKTTWSQVANSYSAAIYLGG